MNKKLIIVGMLALVCASVIAGGFTDNTSVEKTDQNAEIVCEDPRPEICTMDYTPVCGKDVKGDVKTYANGCGACSDDNVVSYQDGECKL